MQQPPLEVISIEKWFKSYKFDNLNTGYSGEWFIRKLKEMVYDTITPTFRKRVSK